MMLSLLLTGCGCPRFSEVVITDPDGLADARKVDRIAAALADVADWTGAAGVCVPEIRVVDGLGRNGRYSGPGLPIEINHHLEDPYTVTIHELCHALDVELGDLAQANASLFDPSTVTAAMYRTETQRIEEAFADRCQSGPKDTALIDALEARCGGTLLDPADQLLRERVYTQYIDHAGPDGTVSFDLERGYLTGADGWSLERLAVGDGAIWAVAWQGSAALVGGVGGVVLRIDPDERAVRDIWSLPITEPGEDWRWISASPPILVWAGEQTRGWQRTDDSWQEVWVPELTEGSPLHGFAEEQTAWIIATLPEQEERTLLKVDRTDGAVEVIVTEGSLSAASPMDGGLSVTTWTDDGPMVLQGTGDGSWQRLPLPPGAITARPLPDGRLLVPWVEGEHAGLSLLDASGWWLDADPCGEAVEAAAVLVVDGQGWVLETDGRLTAATPGGAATSL